MEREIKRGGEREGQREGERERECGLALSGENREDHQQILDEILLPFYLMANSVSLGQLTRRATKAFFRRREHESPVPCP